MSSNSPEKGIRHPNKAKLVARRVVAVGGIAAAAGFVGYKLIKDPLSIEERAEATTIERMRSGEIPTEVISSTLVFKEGVKYRKTPTFHGKDKSAPELDNVAGTVKSGDYLVVDHGLLFTDEEGDDWVGFTVTEVNKKTSEHKDTSDIADDLVWIDTSKIKQQNDENGQPFMSEIDNSGQAADKLITAHIGVNGEITLGRSNSGNDIAAVGRMVPRGAADFILGATDAQIAG